MPMVVDRVKIKANSDCKKSERQNGKSEREAIEKKRVSFLWNKMTIKKIKHGRTRILMMRKNRQTDGHDSTERERLDVNIARAYDIAGGKERVCCSKKRHPASSSKNAM